MMAWLDRILIENWKRAHQLWSVRLLLFWAAFCGLWIALPAFAGFISPVLFALICVGFSITILIARLTKQPGLTV